MSFIKEFKEFALKGNVVELAVAVVIGEAFNKIVGSLITDIITPLLLKPALDFAHLTNLQDLQKFGAKYGLFLAATINFVMVAFVLFLVIKAINATKKKQAAVPVPPPAPSKEEQLLTEIRDLLKNQRS